MFKCCMCKCDASRRERADETKSKSKSKTKDGKIDSPVVTSEKVDENGIEKDENLNGDVQKQEKSLSKSSPPQIILNQEKIEEKLSPVSLKEKKENSIVETENFETESAEIIEDKKIDEKVINDEDGKTDETKGNENLVNNSVENVEEKDEKLDSITSWSSIPTERKETEEKNEVKQDKEEEKEEDEKEKNEVTDEKREEKENMKIDEPIDQKGDKEINEEEESERKDKKIDEKENEIEGENIDKTEFETKDTIKDMKENQIMQSEEKQIEEKLEKIENEVKVDEIEEKLINGKDEKNENGKTESQIENLQIDENEKENNIAIVEKQVEKKVESDQKETETGTKEDKQTNNLEITKDTYEQADSRSLSISSSSSTSTSCSVQRKPEIILLDKIDKQEANKEISKETEDTEHENETDNEEMGKENEKEIEGTNITKEEKEIKSILSVTSLWNREALDRKCENVNGGRPNVKSNLYDVSAYIERTIDDGPEEEGDDSVFEACPNDGDSSKKVPPPVPSIPRWLSEEDGEDTVESEGCSGMQEPPATPVARDELALRRHRFFSELLHVTQSSQEHRVRFDPLGPMVHAGCETNDREEHLEELVNRLENVTRRLERVPGRPVAETQDTAVQTSTPSPKRATLVRSNGPIEDSISSSVSSEERTVSSLSADMAVAGYEDLLAGPVKEYLQLSEKIGGDVATHGKLVEKAFQIQLQFIQTVASRPAPANKSEQIALLGPTSMQIQEIQDFREKNRASPFFNHLSAISESIPALGWVAVAPTPAPYVKEMNDAGQFYTNRVLKEWKEKDKTHVEWCKAWVQTLTDLQQYVRQHHTTGLVWAKTGSAPPAAGIPPPPPPSMPIGDVAPSINDDRSALFAQINQGEGITKSLKKVTSEMQTHKNPSLRTGPAPFKAPAVSNSAPNKTVPPANAPIDKPPVFTKDGKKWLVEYHKGNKDLLIDNVEMNNVIYMFRCQDSTLIVKGKVNSVVMDSCRKSSVVFDSVVSSIEFVNCQSVQMQVLGKVPTISIDKTDGCQMYLSPESLDVELITSKSSEMNVMVPKGNGDYAEYPVPEQFKTTISPKGLSTIAVDSLG